MLAYIRIRAIFIENHNKSVNEDYKKHIRFSFNSLPDGDDFCHQLITFVNSLDSDEACS